jgi:hypothetical protein
MVQFTRNIRLDNGIFTAPELGEPEDNKPNFLAVRRFLSAFYRARMRGKRLVDLGCLDGAHTLGFARMGFDAVGLEVRDANFAACQHVKQHVHLPNLKYIQDDTWNLKEYGPFDVVFCSGLLYHLDRPRDFIRLMSSVCHEMLIINTHFAPEHESIDLSLSEMTYHEGARGRWYAEPLGSGKEERDRYPWASWNNERAFWLAKPDLLQALADAGFRIILESFDFLGPDIRGSIQDGYYHRHHRNMFIAIRDGASEPQTHWPAP